MNSLMIPHFNIFLFSYWPHVFPLNFLTFWYEHDVFSPILNQDIRRKRIGKNTGGEQNTPETDF